MFYQMDHNDVPKEIIFNNTAPIKGYAFVLKGKDDTPIGQSILYHIPVEKEFADNPETTINESLRNNIPIHIGQDKNNRGKVIYYRPRGVSVLACISISDEICKVTALTETQKGSLNSVQVQLKCASGKTATLKYQYAGGKRSDPNSQSIYSSFLKFTDKPTQFISFSRSIKFQGMPSCGLDKAFSKDVIAAFNAYKRN